MISYVCGKEAINLFGVIHLAIIQIIAVEDRAEVSRALHDGITIISDNGECIGLCDALVIGIDIVDVIDRPN